MSKITKLITIVDAEDRVIGAETRAVAREHELIHRIITVAIVNSKSQILLHQRSASLEELPLKWSFAAAGHVDQGEDYVEAATRETEEELGLVGITLHTLGKYYYERPGTHFTLKRFNCVFVGRTDQLPAPNADEVAQTRWVSQHYFESWLKSRPTQFTPGTSDVIVRFGSMIWV